MGWAPERGCKVSWKKLCSLEERSAHPFMFQGAEGGQ